MVMEKLHMSWYEVMWKRSWINIQMMLADSPRQIKSSEIVKTFSGKEMAAQHAAKQKNE